MGTHPIFESDFDCLTEVKMTSLSEAYVNYCIATDGLELDNSLAEVFTQADIELLEGSFNLSFSSRSKSASVMDDQMIDHMFNIIGKKIKDLETLSLNYLPITDIGCSRIATMISEMTSLKTLDLTSCDISNKGIIDVMHALPLSNIKCLILSGNKLEPECCKIIGEKLNLSHLEALEVADCGLSYDGIIAIFNSIRDPNSKLLKLDISGCRLLGCEQNLAYHIEDCLKTNPRLKRLHIRKAGLTDTAVARIASGLQFTDKLTFLDLSANKLSRDSAGLLCPVLEKLETLDLSSNRIQSEGAINIARRIMESNIKLTTLGLKKAEIEDDGIQAILNAVGHENSNIRKIYLWGNNFESGASALLTQLMKDRKISEANTDCRANSAFHPDGVQRPAELNRPNMTEPGVI